MNDRSIPADVICLFHAAAIMLVNDSGIAAIIIDMNLGGMILRQVASLITGRSPIEIMNIGYIIIESIIRSAVVWHIGRIHAIGAGSGFMLPLGTILQPYIDLTCLLFAEVIYNPLPI